MAKWTENKIQHRVADLQQRLDDGQTLAEIALHWGTSKQNVSQFRARYLNANAAPPYPTEHQERDKVPPTGKRAEVEQYSLYVEAYAMLTARDERIDELEEEILRLKTRLHTARHTDSNSARPQEDLQHYILRH